jgi:hypothetical protein
MVNIVAIIIAVISAVSTTESVKVSGKNELKYIVHYVEDEFFGDTERPLGTHYLLSFKDYIEITNTFKADLSNVSNVQYKYTVSETLLIRHQKGADNNTNPVVFEEKSVVFETVGVANNDSISFSGSTENEPGGTYTIYPREYIEIYKQFIDNHANRISRNDFQPDKSVAFTAEVLVQFTYALQIDSKTESITRGIRIPVSIEVFTPEYVGDSNFSISTPDESGSNLTSRTLLGLWLCANISVVYFVNRYLSMKTSKNKDEAQRILKKYSDEIFISEDPLDYSGHKIIHAPQFKELLKLAVNMNKYILCYHDNTKTEFCAYIDGNVFCYKLDYGT